MVARLLAVVELHNMAQHSTTGTTNSSIKRCLGKLKCKMYNKA